MLDDNDEDQHIVLRRRREEALRQLLSQAEGKPSRTIVEEIKKDLGVSRATAYRMVKTFRTCGAIRPSSARPVGRPKGAKMLDPLRENLMQDAIKAFYLQPHRRKFSELVQEIARRCREERLPPPNWRTIRARVRDFHGHSSTRPESG